MKKIIKSIEEMSELSKEIVNAMEDGDVFALVGDLGAGKTTLVSLILKNLDYPEVVSSPTFSIANIYDTKPKINHLDLYRLESEEEIESFEYEEYFYPDSSITFIEWPSMAQSYLPRDIIYIEIKMIDIDRREVTISEKFSERMDLIWKY